MDQRSSFHWSSYLLVLIAAFVTYWGLATFLLAGTYENPFAYFDKLAAAFLRGELYIQSDIKADLTFFGLKWYVPFPPLPALLLVPYMWWTGAETADTVLFSIILSAFNVLMTYGILVQTAKRGWTKINRGDVIWLTVLFGLGTVHLYMALQGSVWFLAQIATYTFAALSVWLALAKRHPILIGLALALAMLARPHIALLGLLLLAIWWHGREDSDRFSNLIKHTAWITLPLLVAVGSLLWYNFTRFEDPLDFGYTSQNVDPFLQDDLDTYGQFNPFFVPRNLRALLWAPPELNGEGELDGFWPNRQGMSIFLTTPVFLVLLWRGRRDWLYAGAIASLALILVPLLTYYNTGWWQFGYRFSLDFMMILMLLLAITAGERLGWVFKSLIVVSVLINVWGMIWFGIITGAVG
ncbi:MAG: hypothetical protein AAF902_19970 [Chloroflexota bacterium]